VSFLLKQAASARQEQVLAIRSEMVDLDTVLNDIQQVATGFESREASTFQGLLLQAEEAAKRFDSSVLLARRPCPQILSRLDASAILDSISCFGAVSLSESKLFVYVSDFDTNGLLYWLGTKKLSAPWRNPHSLGVVEASQSTDAGNNPASNALERPPFEGYSHTGSRMYEWFQVKLLDGCRLNPTRYTLRIKCCRFLRNWDFMGSRDGGTTWEILISHQSDSVLSHSVSSHTWSVPLTGTRRFFNAFRVAITGKESTGDFCVCLSGLELYGICSLSNS